MIIRILLLALGLALFLSDDERTPVEDYARREIRGWTVRVHPELAAEQSELGRPVLELLDHNLYEISRVLPEPALAKVREVTLWMELDYDGLSGAAYHPSRQWLVGNGHDPALARSVQFHSARSYLDWTHVQPSMVLHELAHAYLHQFVGNDDPRVLAAFEKAIASGAYESVLYYHGESKRAYAMNNALEYFAELSEAYFGVNDFYPFVRPEIGAVDPAGLEMIREVWGVK